MKVFSYEICELFKNNPFYRTFLVASSENNEQQQLSEGFANICYKIDSLFLLQELISVLLSASTLVEHFYLLKITKILETRTTYFKQKPHFLIHQPITYLVFMLRCIKSIFFNQSGKQFSLCRVNLKSFILKKRKQILPKQQILF